MNITMDLTGQPARFDGAFRGWRVTRPTDAGTILTVRPRRMIRIAPHLFVNSVSARALGLVAKRARIEPAYVVGPAVDNTSPWHMYTPERLGRIGGPDILPDDSDHEIEEFFWLGRKCRFATRYTASLPWLGVPLRRPLLTASNDNHQPAWKPESYPVKIADIPSPDARRTWLDSLPPWKESDLAGTRIARALKKDAPNAFRQLMLVAALLEPLNLVAANDNNAPEADAELADGFGHERVQTMSSIRPSIPSMLRAYADAFRPRVIIRKDGKVERFGGNGPVCDNGVIQIGGLRFYKGQLHQIHENGKWRKPWVDVTRPATDKPIKGSATEAHKMDWPNVPHRYLGRIGATDWAGDGPIPSQVCAPRGVSVTPISAAKAELRQWLDQQCKGHTVTKCELGVARQYGLLSAVSHLKGTQDGVTTKPAVQALTEIDRDSLRQEVIQKVDPEVVETIEDALADESFTHIGKCKGYEDSSAHHAGKRAVTKALQNISEKIAA
jgi:hypothetical protein